ncbi:hypothetical protein OSB04_000157 [Centaurea solstitialis]|uniref:Reverse transcriptase zinc-binding domain-containing protein n=1 Tax=Centaurea solstitialis TaxID=347529 RepID=A0AA38TZ25_9ASTR|nr:hypothetical protein OSB04_000157 [Centaurea solstitialis]
MRFYRERTKLDAKWGQVVYTYGAALFQVRSERQDCAVWSNILSIGKDLIDIGINIQRLMNPKEDGSGWEWESESNKVFTVRSLWKLIDAITLPISKVQTKWSSWLPSKINIHLWWVSINKLATKENFIKRRLGLQYEECPMYLSAVKCLDHTFVRFSTTKLVCVHLSSWMDWWSMNESTSQGI